MVIYKIQFVHVIFFLEQKYHHSAISSERACSPYSYDVSGLARIGLKKENPVESS